LGTSNWFPNAQGIVPGYFFDSLANPKRRTSYKEDHKNGYTPNWFQNGQGMELFIASRIFSHSLQYIYFGFDDALGNPKKKKF
jgi:hypothetical protein